VINKKLQQNIEQTYEMGELIGSGSYGIIFKARRRSDDQRVAIKCFVSGEAISKNFLNEVKLIFRIQHPHVVKALDIFFANKTYAIVFEYMNGGDLRQHMRMAMPMSQALIVTSQVSSGLQQIHQQGIIHRDLKPENILVHRKEKEITYKVADFNISRFAPDQVLRATDRGSPMYMAPEQFYTDYDHRADFYAMGIILYEMLTGDIPFKGAYQALMQQHIQKKPNLEPIHEWVRPVLEKLLAKAPEDRYKSATDIIRDLNPILLQLSSTGSYVLRFDDQEEAFYLKYLHETLWTRWMKNTLP
jgi:eukaryotic-like serine/threonine-protein kinase